MDKIELLEKKIRQAAEQLISLREDKKKLEAEFSFLQAEHKRIQHILGENEALKDERKTVSARIEKLLKKLSLAQAQS